MELAATLMWRTHYINLTPMYFNKAEGCYKYNPRVCLWSLLHSFLKKKLYYKWTTKAQCFFFLHLYKFSATRGNVGLTFDSSYTSKDTFSNRTNYSDFDSKGELSSIRTVAVCSDRKRSSTSVVWTFSFPRYLQSRFINTYSCVQLISVSWDLRSPFCLNTRS